MNFAARFLTLCVFLLASCDQDPVQELIAEVEKQLPDEEREPGPGQAAKPSEGAETEPGQAAVPDEGGEPAPTEEPKPLEIPVAKPVPDKPGFVVSPFTGKWIDVSDAGAGDIVADPQFAPEEKKYFRVPEFPEPTPEPAESAPAEPENEAAPDAEEPDDAEEPAEQVPGALAG